MFRTFVDPVGREGVVDGQRLFPQFEDIAGACRQTAIGVARPQHYFRSEKILGPGVQASVLLAVIVQVNSGQQFAIEKPGRNAETKFNRDFVVLGGTEVIGGV